MISEYTYDANGNRVAASFSLRIDSITPASVCVGTYDTQDRMLSYSKTHRLNDSTTLSSTAYYIYTANGELRLKVEESDTTRYTYDYFGNLVTVILPRQTYATPDGGHGGQANKDRIDYIIDGQNRRIGKKLNGQIVKRWIYSGQLSPVSELDSAGNVTARFVAKPSASGMIGNYMIKDGTTYQLITDHLGSIRLVVNIADGSIAQRIDYDEYGNVTSSYDSLGIPFGFAGGLYDSHTKLVRFGARDYDATTGRWTAKDPIGFDGGVSNLYEYVINDPINAIDLTGERRYIMVSGSVAAGVTQGPTVVGEGGNFYLYDTQTKQIEGFKYVGLGIGLSVGTPLVSVEVGIVDLNSISQITGFGWATTIASAFVSGIAAQLPASSSIGLYGFGVGLTGGKGFGYGEIATYAWYTGKYSIESLPTLLKEALKKAIELYEKQKNNPCP